MLASRMAKARELFKVYRTIWTRKRFVEAFVDLGMSEQGAKTVLYKLRLEGNATTAPVSMTPELQEIYTSVHQKMVELFSEDCEEEEASLSDYQPYTVNPTLFSKKIRDW